MDAVGNDGSGAYRGESVLKKLRKKYIKRAKRVKQTSLGTKTMISANNLNKHSSLSGSHCVGSRGHRKIQDLLMNNSELAKSLESSRLENCRLEKDNSMFLRQLSLRPIVESKLLEVSTNLSLAASLISETVSMIMEAKQFLTGENMMDTVLTTDSLSKSDDSQPFSHKTPEDNPIPGPSQQKDTWQPSRLRALDMSTITEVSVLSDETRNLLSSGKTPAVRGLLSLEELNRNTSDVFMKPTDEKITSVAEATQQNATPENKELEPSDETPKTPILLSQMSQKFFPSLIPKAVAQCLPFKKRSSYPESQDEAVTKINADILVKNGEYMSEENVIDSVNCIRETVNSGKTKSENANNANDNRNNNCHKLKSNNENVSTPDMSDYTITATSNNLNSSSQLTDHSSSRKTFVVQSKFSCSGVNSIDETSPAFSKSKKSTTAKKTSAKNKSRKDTYLLSKNKANKDHQTVSNVLEDTSDITVGQHASQKLKNGPRNVEDDMNQIQKEVAAEQVSAEAVSSKNTEDSVSDTKSGQFTNLQSLVPVFKEMPAATNTYLPNIAADVHSSSKINKEDKELKLFPDATTFNFIDMSLTEVLHIQPTACFIPSVQATEKEDNPNMQSNKILTDVNELESADLKPELAVNIEMSCGAPANDFDDQFLKVDQVENCAVNPNPAPVEEKTQPQYKNNHILLLETHESEGNDAGETKKLKDKKSEKKPKKVAASKTNKKDAKNHASSHTKKSLLKDKTSKEKGKSVSRPDSLANEVASNLLLLPSQKRKSPIYDIYDDGLNVVSPRKAKEMEEANNIQLYGNCYPSSSSGNKNTESLKANENVTNSKDSESVPSPKKIKLEIVSENNSLVHPMDLSANLGPPKAIDTCPQPGTSSNQKDLTKVTKKNKKSNASKNKKAKPDSATISGKGKTVGRPRVKKLAEAEKENEQVQLSDMSDFYSPIPKVKVSKPPPKKRGRPPKTPLKSRNAEEENMNPLNVQEDIPDSPSDHVTVEPKNVNLVIQVENIFIPIKENLGPDYLNSSFKLKSGTNTLEITSPTRESIELVLPQLREKLSINKKASTPKAIKNSIASASRYTKSVSMEKTRPSVNSSILDSAPRRRKQAVSYREPSLHSKLRRA